MCVCVCVCVLKGGGRDGWVGVDCIWNVFEMYSMGSFKIARIVIEGRARWSWSNYNWLALLLGLLHEIGWRPI